MAIREVNLTGTLEPLTDALDEWGFPVSTYGLVYEVLFDDGDPAAMRPILARNASGIPRLYDTAAGDEWLYVYERQVNQRALFLYQVVVRYRSIENPLSRPPIIEWDEEAVQEPIDVYFATSDETHDTADSPRRALANTANQSFDPAIQETFYDTVLRITVNRPGYNHVMAAEYHGSVNCDPFWGFDVGQVLCRRIHGTPKRCASTWYFEHSYEFVIRDDPGVGQVRNLDDPNQPGERPAHWKRRIKQEGLMHYKDGYTRWSTRELVKATDDDGDDAKEPIALDHDGTPLSLADPNQLPIWYLYKTKPSKRFADLGLLDVYNYWIGLG